MTTTGTTTPKLPASVKVGTCRKYGEGYTAWLNLDGGDLNTSLLLAEIVRRFEIVDNIFCEEYFRGRHHLNRGQPILRLTDGGGVYLYMPGIVTWNTAKRRATDFVSGYEGILNGRRLSQDDLDTIWGEVDPEREDLATRVLNSAIACSLEHRETHGEEYPCGAWRA